MKTARKALLLSICALTLVAASVLGTLAYLTSTTKEVVNSFSIGKVAITLDEIKVDEYGVPLTGDDKGRDLDNTYTLIPGHKYTKDPTVHFASKSEESYLFVKVENGIVDIEAKGEGSNTIAAQIKANGWEQLKDKDGQDVANVFCKKVAENTTDAAVDYIVFSEFIVADDAALTETHNNAKINVIAYAVQADGFTTATEAWTAAPSTWTAPSQG